MKIEKYKKIKDNVYRIFLDNGTIIDAHEDVIIKNNLLYKKEIDINLLNEIEKDNEYQNVYNMALKYIDVLVDGPFILSQKSFDVKFRGSKNQRIIDVVKSLEQSSTILKEEYDKKVSFKRKTYI